MAIKNFLTWVGWLLVGLGVFGYFFGFSWSPTFVFTDGENVAHIVLGAVMLAAAYWAKSKDLIKWLTILVGVVALYFSVYGWFVGNNYYGFASLEQLDNVAHLVIGLWALWAVWGKKM